MVDSNQWQLYMLSRPAGLLTTSVLCASHVYVMQNVTLYQQQVFDVRAPPSSSATSQQGVATVYWPGCHIAAAAAHGTTIAGGGCKGVRAWDVRMASSNTASASSGGGAGAGDGGGSGGGHHTPLVSSRMPNSECVSLLHMERVQLVAATSKSVLHSPASIAVWSLPSGQRVQLLSST